MSFADSNTFSQNSCPLENDLRLAFLFKNLGILYPQINTILCKAYPEKKTGAAKNAPSIHLGVQLHVCAVLQFKHQMVPLANI